MNTILVTGCCGFIGSHFLRLLMTETEWRVVNLDSLTYAGNPDNVKDIEEGRRYRFVKGDIGDRALINDLFQEEQPSIVVNFAAESHVDRSILDASPFLATNIVGVQVLLEASSRHQVERFVQISTDEVYGDVEGKEAMDEISPLVPSSPYSASKAAADLLCLAYQRTHGVPVLITRSSNNYGSFQFPEKLIPLMIRNALLGKTLPVYGDGAQKREWLHVADNVRAILCVVEEGEPGAIYNVGSGKEHTNLDIVRLICQLVAEETGTGPEAALARIQLVSDRPGHDRRYALNSRKINEELGWTPAMPFETGMRQTVRWYLENQELVDRVISGEYRNYYEAVYSNAWGQSS